MREAWKTLLSPTGLAWLQPALPCPPRAAFPVSQGGARAMQVSQARPATLPLHPARPAPPGADRVLHSGWSSGKERQRPLPSVERRREGQRRGRLARDKCLQEVRTAWGALPAWTHSDPPPKGSSSLCACEPLPSKPFEFEIMVTVFEIMVTVFPSPRATPTPPDTPTV